MKHRHKACQNSLFYFTAILGSSLLAITHSSAADYYWDGNNDAAGFTGGTAGTWAAPTAGTATGGFTTSVAGTDIVDGNSVTTTTADNVFLGAEPQPNGYAGSDYTGTITISGSLAANSIFHSCNGLSGSSPTITFSDEGVYEKGRENGAFPSNTTILGAATSVTFKSMRNLNVSNITSNSAGKVILSTSSGSPFPYPGRVNMSASAPLGAVGTPLEFNHGQLRPLNGFPYTSLSALHAEHPVTFAADVDAGLENNNSSAGVPFTIDMDVDLGTGAIWLGSVGSNRDVVLTATGSTWSKSYILGGIISVSDSVHLGPITSPVHFGSGTENLSAGTLQITGTTFSSFGARTLLITDDKTPGFDIAEASHTFTVDQAMTHATGGLDKTGLGTLALSGTANTYTGPTTVNGGTLALVGGSQASPITVSSGALGFTIGSATTSTAAVDLTNGSVAITNPGDVDGSTEYKLMTATGFTFTDITTQLGTPVAGYELELQNSDTELWLVVASNNFATWVGGFGLTDTTFNGDDDGDGLDNGIEGFFGTNPGVSSTGLAEVGKSGDTVTFTHPNPDAADILSDVTGSYEWSLDMVTWYAVDGVEGPGGPPATTTVTTVATADSPAAKTTTVVATIGGTVPEKLFLRVVATQP